MTDLTVPDSPKMLRETLCVAQSALNLHPDAGIGRYDHMYRLQRLIDECDRHRPLGPDGRHGELHTRTCGCPYERAPWWLRAARWLAGER